LLKKKKKNCFIVFELEFGKEEKKVIIQKEKP